MARQYNPASLYIAPTLVIGLGGTGVEIMRLIKARIRRSVSPAPDIVEFLAVDTEMFQNLPGQERIFDREFAYLGDYNATSVLDNIDQHPHIKDWWFAQNDLVTGTIHKGARQRRCVGRLSLYSRWGEFTTRLDPKLRRIREIARKEKEQRKGIDVERNTGLVQVYIIGSVCGGTGSGIILDVAFRIRKVLQDDGDIVAVCLLPSCFVPEVQARIQRQRIMGNAYATLREINHFLKGVTFESCFPDHPYRDGSGRKISYPVRRPFDSVYLIDRSNGREGLSSIDNVRYMAAQQIFLDILTPVGKRFAARRANLRDLASEKAKTGSLSIAGFVTASLILPSRIEDVVVDSFSVGFVRQYILGNRLTRDQQQAIDRDSDELFSDFVQRLRFEKVVATNAGMSLKERLAKGSSFGGTAESAVIDLSAVRETITTILDKIAQTLQGIFNIYGLEGVHYAIETLIRLIDRHREVLKEDSNNLNIQLDLERNAAKGNSRPEPTIADSVRAFVSRQYRQSLNRRQVDWQRQQDERAKRISELQQQLLRNDRAIGILNQLSQDLKRFPPELARRKVALAAIATDILEPTLKVETRHNSALSGSNGADEAGLFELATEIGWENELLPDALNDGQEPFIHQFLRETMAGWKFQTNTQSILAQDIQRYDLFATEMRTTQESANLVLKPMLDLKQIDIKIKSAFRSQVESAAEQSSDLSVVKYLHWFYRYVRYNNGPSRNSPIDPLRMLRLRCAAPFLEIDEALLGTERAADTEPSRIIGVSPERGRDQIAEDVLDEFDTETWEEVNTGVPERIDLTFSRHGYQIGALEHLPEFRDAYRHFRNDLGEVLHIHCKWPIGMEDLLGTNPEGDYEPHPCLRETGEPIS